MHENTLNKKTDTQNLSSIYCYLLKIANDLENVLIDRPAPDE